MSRVLARDVTVEFYEGADSGITECTVNFSTAFVESRVKGDTAPQSTPVRIGCEVSVSGEIGRISSDDISLTFLRGLMSGKGSTTLRIKIGSLATYSGMFVCTSYREDAPVGGNISYSAGFRLVGGLSKVVTT